MPKYRKRPVVIEAEVFHPLLADGINWRGKDSLTYFPKSTQELYWMENGTVLGAPYINTLEGVHYIAEGDYIITGVEGERYPCKPDIFKKTYDLLDDEPTIGFDRISFPVAEGKGVSKLYTAPIQMPDNSYLIGIIARVENGKVIIEIDKKGLCRNV